MDERDAPAPNLNYYVIPHQTKIIDVYITGEIIGPQNYQDSMHIIRTAKQGDEVNIYINSPGGRLDTAVQFVSAMQYCEAPIHIHIEGDCISAATFIAMHGHLYSVNPYSRFMFHNYSGGHYGKGMEMFDSITFMKSWVERYYHDIYKDFLTNDEISSILDGKDLWLDSSEFVERIIKKKDQEYSESMPEEETEVIEQEVQSKESKKKTKKSK